MMSKDNKINESGPIIGGGEMVSSDALIEQAVLYHSIGLSVIPINADKEPIVKGWRKNRINPNGQFNKAIGIGLVCGQLSGGVEAIDIDCKYDNTGTLDADYRLLIEEAKPGLLSRLPIQKTRSNGYHLIYRCPVNEGNLKLASREATEDEKTRGEKIHPLIETRGEGGYIVITPTPGYSIIQGDLSNIPEISTDEREILLSCARRFQRVYKMPYEPKYTSGKSPYQDYNERGNPVELLEAHGWQVVTTQGSEIYLKRPGKTESKWSAGYNAEMKCLYVFSTSTEFDAEKAYNPAAVYCKLEAGDDWSKCASLLLEKGYGERYGGGSIITKQPGQLLSADEIFAKYEHCRVGADKPVPEPTPIYKIHNIPIGTRGSLSALFGGSKAGKTAIHGAIISRLIETSNECDTPREIEVYNPDYRALMGVDTEQSKHHHFISTQRILRRVRIDKEPNHLTHHNIRGFSIADKKQFIMEFFSAANEKHGGICLAVIDGIADFVSSVNNEVEANAIVDFFEKLAMQYDCHIIVVLHFNPKSDKGRGHLGSQLERKSESVLIIERDGDIGTVRPMHLRSGGNSDFPPLHFIYDKTKDYHVFIDSESATASNEIDLQKIAVSVFKQERKSGDAVSLIMQNTGVKNRKAKEILKAMVDGKIIAGREEGRYVFYSLKIADDAPT